MRSLDERGVIVSWLMKLLVGFAIAGVLLFDAGSVIVNFFTLDSVADDLANALTTEVATGSTTNVREIETEARAYLDENAPNAKLLKLTINTEEKTVTVRLRRRAETLVLGRIGWTKDWTKATADSRSRFGQ